MLSNSEPHHAPARWLFGGLLLYFTLQLLVRMSSAQGVELDEAEQLLWTQQLAAGYGPQPPLYTWLQLVFFQVFSVSIFALALLKNLLLFGTYSCTWLAARRVLPPMLAALSSAALLLLLQIVWESQRDLTHSVLVTTAASATLWLLIELVQAPPEKPRAHWYAALGLAVACGLLAKYSFVMFMVAMGGALLWAPATRQVLLDRRALWTLAIAALLVAPHAFWVAGHWGSAVHSTAGKLASDQARGIGQIGRGLGSLALMVPSFLSPLWQVFALLFGVGWKAQKATCRAGRDPRIAGLFVRYLLLLAALLVAMVVIGGAAHFKDRWLQPLLVSAPLMFFVAWPGLLHHRRLRGVAYAALAMALTCLVLLALRPWYDGHHGEPGDQNLPIAALAARIRQAGPEPAVVVSNENHLAGSMRLAFTAARIVAPSAAGPTTAPRGPTLLLAYADRFAALRASRAEWAAVEPTLVDVPFDHAAANTPPARFAYALIK